MFYCNDYIALPFFYVSYFSSNSSDLCRIPYFVTQRILMMPSILRGIKIERESVNLDRPLELDILIRNERRPTVELIHQTRVFFSQSKCFILLHNLGTFGQYHVMCDKALPSAGWYDMIVDTSTKAIFPYTCVYIYLDRTANYANDWAHQIYAN